MTALNRSEDEYVSSPSFKARTRSSDERLSEIESLGNRCREGDISAWTCLFPLVWPVLVRFVHRLYHSFDEQDSEDVAQAALEAAIRGIYTFTGRALFRAWLFGIAAQQANTFFRRKSAAKRGFAVVVPFDRSIELRDSDEKSPAEITARNERAAILHRAIAELPEDDRDLVQLHYFGELTFKEIGELRDINPKTVCTRFSRSKARLLDLLIRSNLTKADG